MAARKTALTSAGHGRHLRVKPVRRCRRAMARARRRHLPGPRRAVRAEPTLAACRSGVSMPPASDKAGAAAAGRIEFDDPHAQAGPVEAEVTRVRKLTGAWRWLLVAHDGGHHRAVHQPAVHAAILRRLHAAQHRILLPADLVHAAVHLRHLSGQRARAARPRALVRRGSVPGDGRGLDLISCSTCAGRPSSAGSSAARRCPSSSPASSCGCC